MIWTLLEELKMDKTGTAERHRNTGYNNFWDGMRFVTNFLKVQLCG